LKQQGKFDQLPPDATISSFEGAVMPVARLIQHYPDFFVSEIREDILWARLSGNFFHNLISFDKRDFINDYLEEVNSTTQVKTVVFHSNYNESGIDQYVKFFLSNLDKSSFVSSMASVDVNRFSNIINQTILRLMDLNKYTIQICQGPILNLFMNLGFTCDYRIIADDTVFHNGYKHIGGLPLAGGSFFLSKLLGRHKANELLLLEDRITAGEALSYGIVDKVVPAAELEQAALDTARKIDNIDHRTLRGVKRLTRFSVKDLKDYLTLETNELLRVCVEMGRSTE
jgi:2-(1,2-epoxy-1,2-dihydrophenyl)acetyl-CoA isomerase